jgi:hypothetical protein
LEAQLAFELHRTGIKVSSASLDVGIVGVNARRDMRPDRKQAIMPVDVMRRPLAIAQQTLRDFLDGGA